MMYIRCLCASNCSVRCMIKNMRSLGLFQVFLFFDLPPAFCVSPPSPDAAAFLFCPPPCFCGVFPVTCSQKHQYLTPITKESIARLARTEADPIQAIIYSSHNAVQKGLTGEAHLLQLAHLKASTVKTPNKGQVSSTETIPFLMGQWEYILFGTYHKILVSAMMGW